MTKASASLIKGFITFSPADTFSAVHTMGIGLYGEDGGCEGEFSLDWVELGSHGLSIRLGVFDDAWAVLAKMPELIALLADLDVIARGSHRSQAASITPEEMAEHLKAIGFADLTRKPKIDVAMKPIDALKLAQEIVQDAISTAQENDPSSALEQHRKRVEEIRDNRLPAFNETLRRHRIGHVDIGQGTWDVVHFNLATAMLRLAVLLTSQQEELR